MTRKPSHRQNLRATRFGRLAISLVLWGVSFVINDKIGGFGSTPVLAQTLRAEQVAEIVYQRLPYLPKENQYQSQETGAVNPDHTLISRFIRYHQDLQKRPSAFTIDWRITLADYLGVNETMAADRYPGAATLTINPQAADIEAIRRLNRRQRQELVDLLVSLYMPRPQGTPSNQPEKPETLTPARNQPASPALSRPGDAQLLAP